MEKPIATTDNENLLQQASNPGFLADFWDFLRTSKKWWLLPLLLLFLRSARSWCWPILPQHHSSILFFEREPLWLFRATP